MESLPLQTQPTPNIKVALLADVLKENLDGVTVVLHHILQSVPKDKFQYFLVSPHAFDSESSFSFSSIQCPFLPVPMYPEYPIALPFLTRKISKALQTFKPDVIHIVAPSLLGIFGLWYGRKYGVPVIATYHTHFIRFLDHFVKNGRVKKGLKRLACSYAKWFYRKCAKILVHTNQIKTELVEAGIHKETLHVWERGVDGNLYQSDARDNHFMERLCGNRSKRLLFVSRLVPEKGLATLIALYQQFQTNRLDIQFVIAGEGPKREYLETHMPNAIFTGKVVGERLAKIYASCDVFVFTSIIEDGALVVLEAMASGLPVVVPMVKGTFVEDGVTGLLAQPNDASDFCRKIKMLVDSPSLARTLKENALTFSKTKTWNAVCRQYFACVKHVATKSANHNFQNDINSQLVNQKKGWAPF